MSKKPEKTFEIDFEPIGKRTLAGAGETLLDAARASGVQIASLCGGSGLCESCVIRLRDGALSDPTLDELAAWEDGWLDEGERLACQASPISDVIIDIPPKSLTTSQRLQLEGMQGQVQLNPTTHAIDLHVKAPSTMTPEAILTALHAALGEAGIGPLDCDPELLADMAKALDQNAWDVRIAFRDDEIIGVIPSERHLLGLAIDLGTTKLAVYLLDLETGETLAHSGAMNPQISYGEDVVSRISYANQGNMEREQLSQTLIDRLNSCIAELVEVPGCSRDQLVEAVVVGNTVMHHTFLGLPLRQLGVSPFTPAVEGPQLIRSRDLELDLAPGAYVYLPPNIAGYVGADHTAVLLSTGFGEPRKGSLVVDIGTNTEISLQIGSRILSCSCASGPAFEGAHIRDGMRAAAGAIERVQAANGGLRWQTVDDEAPIGICGSGILDAVASMRSLGWVDRSGRLNHDLTDPEYRHAEGICLVPAEESGHGSDIVITRHDIHEVQLAQGAIRAGIEVLLGEADLTTDELERMFLAGAFGTYLNPTSAMASGMLPSVDKKRIYQVGNAAGEGARQLLLSVEKRLEVEAILKNVEYIELTTHPAFTDLYMRYLYLG